MGIGNRGKIFLLVILTGVFTSLTFAQQELKIGIINSQEVLEKSVEGKKVLARLEERRRQNQANIAKLDDEIRQLETKLSTQRLTLTEEAAMQHSSDLDKKRTEKQRLSEDLYKDFQEFASRLMNKLQNELLPIVDQLGKERNFDIIFDLARSGAVYFNPTIDLTADIIKRFDATKTTPTK